MALSGGGTKFETSKKTVRVRGFNRQSPRKATDWQFQAAVLLWTWIVQHRPRVAEIVPYFGNDVAAIPSGKFPCFESHAVLRAGGREWRVFQRSVWSRCESRSTAPHAGR